MSFDLTGILELTQDSRNIRPGSLFVALRGGKHDGVQYIPQAESLGAVAVLCAEDAVVPPTTMRVLRAKEPRLAMAKIAASMFAAQPAHLVAVTGTDGKTSTADFFRQLTHLAGHKSASIGTLGVIAGDGAKLFEATHTTPDAIALHRWLSEMAAQGVSHACLEASSHGLDQYRLHGVRLEAAAFTNIARDHLDYHHTEEAYFAAKAKLFSEVLPEGKTAVLNADDLRAPSLVALCRGRNQTVVDFGKTARAMRIISVSPHALGQRVECELFGTRHALDIPLVGYFQVMNIFAAMGLAHVAGVEIPALLAAIGQLQGVPGRLQLAANTKNGAGVYVDYAHTPAALENILRTLRPHTQGKLHVVFGCGGNRDAGKRMLMGKAANDCADVVMVTDDNPRNEDPDPIRAAILSACPKGTEVADRKEAIHAAIAGLQAGDVLVIAGKGHEKTQIIGNVEHPHDDVEVARETVNSSIY